MSNLGVVPDLPIESILMSVKIQPLCRFNNCVCGKSYISAKDSGKNPSAVRIMFESKSFSILLVGACWLAMFGMIIIGYRVPVLVDAGHFYEPLFRWNAQQQIEGQLPVWNANDNLGIPIAADATSSVFYPLKQIFRLEAIPFHARNGIYTAIHVLIAAAGMFLFVRRLKCGRLSATLSAISFAFGGSVLFHTSNIVFLVGAAWLPWAAMGVWQIHRTRQWRWGLMLSMALSMMVLGGDPQMAYHVGMMGAILWLFTWLARIRQNVLQRKLRGHWDLPIKSGAIFASSVLLAGGISAIQILPTLDWSKASSRKTFEKPRNIYEVPAYLARGDSKGWSGVIDGIFGELEPDTHQDYLYHFSQPPWTMAELIWPNVSGRMTPTNARWSTRAPSLGRVWQSSLYLGLIPLLLAVCGLSLWGRDRKRIWLSWIAILSVLASFGWYGLGWMIKIAGAATLGIVPEIQNQVGGIYWSLVTFAPGYSDFRYPAKLFVVSNFAISMLAGIGFGYLRFDWFRRRLLLLSQLTGAASIVGLGYVFLRHDAILASLQSRGPDNYFGPFDAFSAMQDIKTAFLQTIIVVLCSIAAIVFVSRSRRYHSMTPRQHFRSASIALASLVVISAVDILFANQWIMPTVQPRTANQRTAGELNQLLAQESADLTAPNRIYRTMTDGFPSWTRDQSANRVEEIYQWENDVLDCCHGMALTAPMIGIAQSIHQQDYEILFSMAREISLESPALIADLDHEILNALSAKWILIPASASMDHHELIPVSIDLPNNVVQLFENPEALPRAWVVHQVQAMPPLTSSSDSAVKQRTRSVLLVGGRVRDFGSQAVVETDSMAAGTHSFEESESAESSTCRFTERSNQHLVLVADMQREGLVVVNDYFETNWTCQTRRLDSSGGPVSAWQEAEILRTNRIMRGVKLPRGKFEIRMQYQPHSLWRGGLVSLLSSVFLILAIIVKGTGPVFDSNG